jgi:hypothetical protein
MDYILVESLPAGWGYMHIPMTVRYARNFDQQVQGMTGTFHEVWGDFGTVKHEVQLKCELATSRGRHARKHGSLGDRTYRTKSTDSAGKRRRRRRETAL